MLSARELNRAALQQSAPSWVNQRLKFTHGYGVTMSLVSAIAEEGRPETGHPGRAAARRATDRAARDLLRLARLGALRDREDQ